MWEKEAINLKTNAFFSLESEWNNSQKYIMFIIDALGRALASEGVPSPRRALLILR